MTKKFVPLMTRRFRSLIGGVLALSATQLIVTMGPAAAGHKWN